MAFVFNFVFPEAPSLRAEDSVGKSVLSAANAETNAQPEIVSLSDKQDSVETIDSHCSSSLPSKEHALFRDKDDPLTKKLDVGRIPLLSSLVPETEWNNFTVEDTTLQFVCPKWLDRKLASDFSGAKHGGDQANASDIVPNVYEGGFRVWDGACDMLTFLVTSEHIDLKNKKVLELGCGAGLPGIYAFLQGAHVHFHDYNEEVIQSATIPNIQQNLLATKKLEHSELAARTRLFSGDWLHFVDHLDLDDGIQTKNEKGKSEDHNRYDVILTSDTVYRKDVLRKLCSVLPKLLRKDGTIYLAGKSHYFGLDGGTDELRLQLAKQGELQVVLSKEYPDGVRREVITIRRKSNVSGSDTN